MTFHPGELDQLIDIQREVSADDGMGGQTITLTNVATGLWAKRRPLSGKEFARYDQLNASNMCAFVIRFRDDLLINDRILSEGAYYNIRYIPPSSSRLNYLVLEAESGVAL